jgi:hypothetical protein
MFYDLPVTSGNKVLVFDGGTFTYGSGNYTGVSSDYQLLDHLYSQTIPQVMRVSQPYLVMLLPNTVMGTVVGKDIFGTNTITVKLRGNAAVTS